MKIRFIFVTMIISIGLLHVACGQSPEKSPRNATAAAEKRLADQKKTVRVKHLAGEVQSVNSKAKTIIVRFKDEDVEMKFDGSTIVKVDLDSVKPADIPPGARATVKYVVTNGRCVAKGIFISTQTAEKKEGPPLSSCGNSA